MDGDGEVFRTALSVTERLSNRATFPFEIERAGLDASGARRVSGEKAACLRLLLHAAVDLSAHDIALLAADVARGASPDRGHWKRVTIAGEAGRGAAGLWASYTKLPVNLLK